MPTIEANYSRWDQTYDWGQAGEEWSTTWGSSHMQWYGTILPRIGKFLPANTIVEIAPGYGRWTRFLKGLCNNLIVVDLSEKCIDTCKRAFAECPHISYFVNDGRSLEMIPDRSIDFVFSFDSLVHAEDTVLKAYTSGIAKKLTPNGAAFLHHSNLGEYTRRYPVQPWLSKRPRLLRPFNKLGVFWEHDHWREPNMTAGKMAMFAEEHGLQCISQELVNWGDTGVHLVDCMSTLVPRGSRWSRPNRIFRNGNFMLEARRLADLSRLY